VVKSEAERSPDVLTPAVPEACNFGGTVKRVRQKHASWEESNLKR
jgi:hypothetical protein